VLAIFEYDDLRLTPQKNILTGILLNMDYGRYVASSKTADMPNLKVKHLLCGPACSETKRHIGVKHIFYL